MNKRIAILIENNYEDQEFWYPYLRLKEEGYEVDVVGPEFDVAYKSKHGYPVKSTICRFDANKKEWDAVIIPGGWAPDKLRCYPEMVELVRKINKKGGIVAAICHGGSMLVSAGIIEGKKVTAYKAIKDDLVYAGGIWKDEAVVVDGNLINSRTPKDLTEFMKAILSALE